MMEREAVRTSSTPAPEGGKIRVLVMIMGALMVILVMILVVILMLVI